MDKDRAWCPVDAFRPRHQVRAEQKGVPGVSVAQAVAARCAGAVGAAAIRFRGAGVGDHAAELVAAVIDAGVRPARAYVAWDRYAAEIGHRRVSLCASPSVVSRPAGCLPDVAPGWTSSDYANGEARWSRGGGSGLPGPQALRRRGLCV